MSKSAKVGNDHMLKIEASIGGGVGGAVNVGEVLDFSGPSMARTVVEVTHQKSTWIEKRVTIPSAGQITMQINLVDLGASAGQNLLFDAFEAPESAGVQWSFWMYDQDDTLVFGPFKAYVLSIEPSFPVKDRRVADVVFQITDTPTIVGY